MLSESGHAVSCLCGPHYNVALIDPWPHRRSVGGKGSYTRPLGCDSGCLFSRGVTILRSYGELNLCARDWKGSGQGDPRREEQRETDRPLFVVQSAVSYFYHTKSYKAKHNARRPPALLLPPSFFSPSNESPPPRPPSPLLTVLRVNRI